MAKPATRTPELEEREARKRQRAIEKARAARSQLAKRSRADVSRACLKNPAAQDCQCGIRPEMSLAELIDLGAGCTAGTGHQPGYVCPTLDRIRRRLGA